MKELIIEKKHAPSLLQFIKDEVINYSPELEDIIIYRNSYNKEEGESTLYDCFNSLLKIFTMEDLENKFNLLFPYGILISPKEFNYEIVRKYVEYISLVYNYDAKVLFFNPELFFKTNYSDDIEEKIKEIFNNFKYRQFFLGDIVVQLQNEQHIKINIDKNKFSKTKLILNVTESSKDLMLFLFENEVFYSDTKVIYNGKEIFLLEYWLYRSLTSCSELINKMILNLDINTGLSIQLNIKNNDFSYLNSFEEEKNNFYENIQLLNKKLLMLKLEDERDSGTKTSSGSGKCILVKI